MAGVEESRNEVEWVRVIGIAAAKGDYFRAIDLADQALQQHQASLVLSYWRMLSFVRVGSLKGVEAELATLESEGRLDGIEDKRLRADFLSLRGRLLKERATRALHAQEREDYATRAAQVYERVFSEFNGAFPAINAGTLWRVAKRSKESQDFAERALDQLNHESDPYWRAATEAEAWTLLEEEGRALAAVERANAAVRGRYDMLASTRKQFDWLERSTGLGGSVLAALSAPRILHWFFNKEQGASDLPEDIERSSSGVIGFCTPLSPLDIEVAGALHAVDGELNLVLPCEATICRSFVEGAWGGALARRFDALVEGASNVGVVTAEGDPTEPTAVRLAIMQSLGQAVIRGSRFATKPERLTVGPRGLAAVELTSLDPATAVERVTSARQGSPIWAKRRAKALVFGDVRGFGKISEAQHPAFFEAIIGGFADVLAPFEEQIECASTAGDGVFLVFSETTSAARACEALQGVFDEKKLEEAGLPATLGLRLSAHLAPVFTAFDRVMRRNGVFGREVVRAARIEPVTPVGETYVTEQFASMLVCCSDGWACDYVGLQPLAKGFGTCRMYSLRKVR
jgi:class 3 adenylate cyclase/tetratricopeptide (TPR) repeat protein